MPPLPCLATRYTHLSDGCLLKAFNLEGEGSEEGDVEGEELGKR